MTDVLRLNEGKLKTAKSPENMTAVEAKKIQDSWGVKREDIGSGKEWWVLFGETRTGKTYQYLTAFEYHVSKEMEIGTAEEDLPHMYVIDMDLSGERDLESFPMLQQLGLVHHRPCTSVDEVMIATAALVGNRKMGVDPMVKKGDWIVVDRATTVWKLFPDYYTRTRLLKSADDLEFEYYAKEGEGKLKGGSGMLQYYRTGINPLWHTWELTLRLSPAHVILVTTTKDLAVEKTAMRDKKDDVQQIANFQSIGVVPAMQDDTWPNYHTQLFISRPYSTKEFFIKTMGERGDREWLGANARQKIGTSYDGSKRETKNLGELYLGEVCGWDKKYADILAKQQKEAG